MVDVTQSERLSSIYGSLSLHEHRKSQFSSHQVNASGEEAGPLQEAFKKLAFPDENCQPETNTLTGLPHRARASHLQEVYSH